MQQPPLLPELVLARVRRVGLLHGRSVLFVAGLFALLSALAGDYLGAIIGLLVAGAGAVEHHGAALLGEGEPRGTAWLVGSQGFLFFSILVYCVVRLARIELPPIPDEMKPMIEMSAAQLNLTAEAYLTLLYRFGFWLVIVLSVFYQGGMALYYFSKRRAIRRALDGESLGLGHEERP